MMQSDPLRIAELVAIIEEATTPVRHDLRNRIATVRNLAYFVRRKLSTEESSERDPRVNEFLLKIEHEVQLTDEVIEAWTSRVQGVRPQGLEVIRAASGVRLAVECARLPSSVTLTSNVLDETLLIDGEPQALAVAVRCLLENSGEAPGVSEVRLSLARELDNCVISVSDNGTGMVDPQKRIERFKSTKPGHLGLGLCIAQRVALRSGGDLIIGTPATGAQVSLRIPLAGEPSVFGGVA